MPRELKKRKKSGHESDGATSRRDTKTKDSKSRSGYETDRVASQETASSQERNPYKLYGGGVRLEKKVQKGASLEAIQEDEGGVSLTADLPSMTTVSREMESLSMQAPYTPQPMPPQLSFTRDAAGNIGVENRPNQLPYTRIAPATSDHPRNIAIATPEKKVQPKERTKSQQLQKDINDKQRKLSQQMKRYLKKRKNMHIKGKIEEKGKKPEYTETPTAVHTQAVKRGYDRSKETLERKSIRLEEAGEEAYQSSSDDTPEDEFMEWAK